MAEICAVIARRRHKKILEEMDAAAEQGVRLIEIRLDIASGPLLGEILKHRHCPMIATIRRRQDGGQWSGSEVDRQRLLRTAIAEGFDYVDIEYDVAKDIPRYGATKRIVSYHNLAEMPAEIDRLHKKMSARDPDVVKIACRANDPADIFTMTRLVRKAKVPTIAIAMGELGKASRILGAKYGSPFTYAAFNERAMVAPGIPTFAELRELYRFESIDRETEFYGVIGDPIGHSLSPLVHNTCFAESGLNKVYVPIRVPSDCLDGFFGAMDNGTLGGLSVTIPHKERVCRLGRDTDALVELTGSANTLLRHNDSWNLANTDGPAAVGALEEALAKTSNNGMPSVEGRLVLVLGAGGVARTIAHTLRQRGAIVSITNRHMDRALRLARQVDCKTTEWTNRHALPTDVLINCTPVGMHPDVGKTPFQANGLRENMIVFDTIYNPEKTLLIREAEKQGCITVTGVEMFVRQAEAQFRMFTGSAPPIGLMGILVREELSPARNMLREVRLQSTAQSQSSHPTTSDRTPQ